MESCGKSQALCTVREVRIVVTDGPAHLSLQMSICLMSEGVCLCYRGNGYIIVKFN